MAGSGPSLGGGTIDGTTTPSPFAVDFNLRLILTADLPATGATGATGATAAAGSGPSLGDGTPPISLGDIRKTQSLYNNNNHTIFSYLFFNFTSTSKNEY